MLRQARRGMPVMSRGHSGDSRTTFGLRQSCRLRSTRNPNCARNWECPRRCSRKLLILNQLSDMSGVGAKPAFVVKRGFLDESEDASVIVRNSVHNGCVDCLGPDWTIRTWLDRDTPRVLTPFAAYSACAGGSPTCMWVVVGEPVVTRPDWAWTSGRCHLTPAQAPNSIEGSRNAKTGIGDPSVDGTPQSRAGTEAFRIAAEPRTAAQHTMAAVRLPAVLRPLIQIPDHVRQAGCIRAVGADRTRSPVVRPLLVAAGLRPRCRSSPFRLRGQSIARIRRPTQPRHICLCIIPAHTRHWMTVRLPKAGVPPRVAITIRGTAAARTASCRRRERPILTHRDLVATQRETTTGQNHHLRAGLAVPEHLARLPARIAGRCNVRTRSASARLPEQVLLRRGGCGRRARRRRLLRGGDRRRRSSSASRHGAARRS